MITFCQITKRYQTQEALSNISFHLNPGEMAFLIGHSGAGKTTLLRLIAKLENPSLGNIVVNQQNIAQLSKKQIPYFRRQIGLILQDSHLLFNQTIADNVALPLIINNYDKTETQARTRAALDKIGLLHKAKALPETLSCGEQQRVNIARAIVTKPPIILADEPTGNLDPELSKEIINLFKQFNQLGTTILIATHDAALAETFYCRELTLQSGRLVDDSIY